MSLPESRRDSEVETSSLSGNAYKSDTNFRREEFLDTFNSQQNVVRMHIMVKTKPSFHIKSLIRKENIKKSEFHLT